MSNPYLERLRGRAEEKTETQHPLQPSKPPKPGFDSFGGYDGKRFFENEAAEEASENFKKVSPGHRQNCQNPHLPAEPSGVGCKVTIVEIPATGLRYRRTFAHLQLTPPALVDVACWRQCVEDGKRFLAKWGEQAEALGWTSADLFGLAPVPEQPHPSYRRLSRYDCTGLVWLLDGRPVVALTETTASVRHPTGSITTYRRFNKPAELDCESYFKCESNAPQTI